MSRTKRLTIRRTALWALLVAPGVFVVAVGLYGALQDWPALRAAHEQFDRVARSDAALRAVFVAEARQNIHRVNLFADVVWALLGALWAALGIHGLCLIAREEQ